MLVYESETKQGHLNDETHVNPEHVAFVTRRIKGPEIYRHEATTIGGDVLLLTKDGYDRIVAWMEKQDGEIR